MLNGPIKKSGPLFGAETITEFFLELPEADFQKLPRRKFVLPGNGDLQRGAQLDGAVNERWRDLFYRDWAGPHGWLGAQQCFDIAITSAMGFGEKRAAQSFW